MVRKNISTKVFFIVSISLIYSTLAPAQISFTKHIIDDNFGGAYTVVATDIDGDGYIDILGGAQRSSQVAWWRNDGHQNFLKHTIDPYFSYVWCIKAADLDSDGDMDVVGASCGYGELAWWENDGNENFTKYDVDSDFETAESVYAIDVDGDGDMDVVGAATYPADIAWYENDGHQKFTKHIIDGEFVSAHAMYAADVDSDGDVDVLGAATSQRNIVWWENDGNENFSSHTISSGFGGAYCVYAEDVDSDDDMDILGAAHSLSQIAWWENGGNQNFRMHVIEENFVETHYVYAADIDVDGDIDILGTSREYDQVVWWENDGYEDFTKHVLDDNFDGAHSVYATDIDGDGDTDILAAALWGDDIAWWENNMPPTYYSISGNISYYCNGLPVEDVRLTIDQELPSTETTDANGNYSFEAERRTSFTVTPSKPVAEDVGQFTITAYDAALTARHAINIETLNDLQQTAADANRDGHIYTFDAALICRYAVGLPALPGSHVGEWLFLPENRFYENLDSDRADQDYTGIIIGNVHENWMSEEGLHKLSHTFQYYENLHGLRCKNEELFLPLTVNPNQEILSVDIELSYDSRILEFAEIIKTELSQNFQIFYNSENGLLRIAMYATEPVNDGGILVNLVFNVTANTQNITSLHLKRFQLNNNVIMHATTQVSLVKEAAIPSKFWLGQNYPNPFNSITVLSFQIPRSGRASLKIYDLSGREVRTLLVGEMEAGLYQLNWDGKNQAGESVAGGIYIYQLQIENHRFNRKLLKLE